MGRERSVADWEADVLLRDGHPVHLRPITPADGPELRSFHRSLSPQAVYFRFFSAKPELTDADIEYFTHVDQRTRVALLALDRERVIGVGRFDALGDGRAEVAFVVRDDMQGLGLGSILLEHLAAAGREVGIHRFVAEVLPENARMLSTFRKAGYTVDQRRRDDVIAVGFDIEPTQESRSVMAAREQRAEARSMQRMLSPRTVAVVGASRRPGGLGHAVLRHLVEGGFRGELFAVHREVDAIAGVRCVRSLTDLAEPPDLVVVVVPAAEVPAVLGDAAAAHAHGLVVVSGGFGDSGDHGDHGMERQAGLVDAAHRAGLRVVGPNALGVINTDPTVRLNASLAPRMPREGKAGLFVQSGALGIALLDRLADRDLGVSTMVSAGNRADVSGNDLLQYWEDDPRTSVVLMHLESIGNARKFARLVRRMSRTKPVVMVRTGGSRAQHPLGHAVRQSLLAQSAVDQVLADCGLVVVDSVDRLIDAGRLMAEQSLPRTDSVAIVSNSDALAVLAANAVEDSGLQTHEEAMVFPRRESVQEYSSALDRLVHDESVGAVIAIHVPPVESPDDEEIREVLRPCRGCGSSSHAPVVAVLARGARSAPAAPTFADVEEAVAAIASARGVATWRSEDARRLLEPRPQWPDEIEDEESPAGVLDGDEAVRMVQRALGLDLTLALEGAGDTGCHVRLIDDPAFGSVICIGVDDPVAELLDDRAYRLAPVTVAGAEHMLRSLGALSVLLRGFDDGDATVARLARAVSAISHLHVRGDGVRSAEFRHLVSSVSGDLTVTAISATVGPTAVEADPAVRRL